MSDPSPPSPRWSRAHAAIVRNRAFANYPQRQLQLLMDVYRPETDEDVPVVLWLHDGGWRAGSKDHCPVRWLVRYGYAVAAANYRLLPYDRYPAPIEDARAAVRYLRHHAEDLGLKPDAIAACGASTGAYLACMLGVAPDDLPPPPETLEPASGAADRPESAEHDDQSHEIRAVVNYFGFTDFMGLQSLPSRRDQASLNSPEARFLGVPPRRKPEYAAAASPLTHVRPGLPPMIHLHGEVDRVVPLDQSRRFHDALRVAGNVSKLVMLKGLGHRGLALFNHEAARGRVVDFLHQHFLGYVPTAARYHGRSHAETPIEPGSPQPPASR
ncbi:MAG: alpha/beta hydrolase [Planctomycetota bacterium]